MRSGQYFALITGGLFLLMGIMGFVPAFVREPVMVADEFSRGYADLLGVFPINSLHNATIPGALERGGVGNRDRSVQM